MERISLAYVLKNCLTEINVLNRTLKFEVLNNECN